MKLQVLHEAKHMNAPKGELLNRVFNLIKGVNPSATEDTVAKLAAYIEFVYHPPEDSWLVLYNGTDPIKDNIPEMERIFREFYDDFDDIHGDSNWDEADDELIDAYKEAPFKT